MTRNTSAATYRQIESQGLLSAQRFSVYDALYQFGPCTAGELADAMVANGIGMKETRHTVSRRLPELRDFGVAKECRERLCKSGGRHVIEWDVTADLPQRPKQADDPARKSRKDLEADLQRHRNAMHEALTIVNTCPEHQDRVRASCPTCTNWREVLRVLRVVRTVSDWRKGPPPSGARDATVRRKP